MSENWSSRFLRTRTPGKFYTTAGSATVFAGLALVRDHRAFATALASAAVLGVLCGAAAASRRVAAGQSTLEHRSSLLDLLVAAFIITSISVVALAVVTVVRSLAAH